MRRENALKPRRIRNALSDMDSYLFKHVRPIASIVAVIVLGSAVLWIGLRGIHRSLWLDEAWVANSIRAISLEEMFRGGEWLQSTPPAFLLLARGIVKLWSFSTSAFRSLSLVFALAAVVAMWFTSRRVAPVLGPILAAALVLPAQAMEYFTTFKQYGAEAAATAFVLWATFAYLQFPNRRRFVLVCIAITAFLPLAYPLAFLIPGIILAVFRTGGWRRAAIVIASSAAMLGLLYIYFIRPNVAPRLWDYWNGGFAEAYSPGVWLLIALGSILSIRAAWRRDYEQLVCLLPCLLLVVAERAHLYPASTRTRLFIRPCILLAAAMFAEEFISKRRWNWLQPIAAVAAIVWAASAAAKYRPLPIEDYRATIAYLQQHLTPGDLLVIHPDAREGMILYSAMNKWELPAIYGNTGWPCCPRSRPVSNPRLPAIEAIAALRNDLARMIPHDFHGRVFLVYANRWLHWRYIGIHEGDLWRGMLWAQGCVSMDNVTPENMVIASLDCSMRN